MTFAMMTRFTRIVFCLNAEMLPFTDMIQHLNIYVLIVSSVWMSLSSNADRWSNHLCAFVLTLYWLTPGINSIWLDKCKFLEQKGMGDSLIQ